MARVLWAAVGIASAFRSSLDFEAPQYYHPVSLLDYLAVWSYTVALILTAFAIVSLARLSTSRSVRAVAIVAAAGAFAAGVANALEDALRLSRFGRVYAVGTLVMVGGLLAVALILVVLRQRRLAAAFVGWCAGIFLAAMIPGGGVVVLAVLGAVALWPNWFAAGDRPGRDDRGATIR